MNVKNTICRRWHQLFRDTFTTLAYKPLSRIFSNSSKLPVLLSRAIPLCGVFALSGIECLVTNMLTFTCVFSEPAQPLQNTFIIGLCHTYIIYTTFDTLSPSTFTFFMLHAAGSILETSVQQHFQQFIRKHPYASRFIGWTWFVSFFTLTGPLFLAPYLKLADTVNVPVSLVGWALGVRPMILPVV